MLKLRCEFPSGDSQDVVINAAEISNFKWIEAKERTVINVINNPFDFWVVQKPEDIVDMMREAGIKVVDPR
jgi:hypothetical protein